jgi:hypothetical protein
MSEDMPEQTASLITAMISIMYQISEDCYAAVWMSDLEYDLWGLIVGDLKGYGMCDDEETSPRVAALDALSNLTGLWIRWNPDPYPGGGPGPIALSQWRQMYAQKRGVA